MNNPIRRLAVVVTALFCALFMASTWIQFVQADTLRDQPGNRRTLLSTYAQERGSILVDGEPVATSRPTNDDFAFRRSYPRGELYSHVTGYQSFVYGAGGGLESAADDLLTGRADQLFYRRLGDMITGRRPTGVSLELTIDPRAQEAADKALGDQRGAVVALDPKTGAILAMVSHPTYDPNSLSSHDTARVQAAWKTLQGADTSPLTNRTVQSLYPPGSVFKLVTAAAALSSGRFDENSSLPGPAVLDLPETTAGLPNSGGGTCGGGNVTLTQALEVSCNTAFGWLGLQLGGQAMRDQAAKFGFSQQVEVPMKAAASSVPAQMNRPQEAQSAIGQYDVLVTPLQVAMVSAAIANGGTVMKPYLVGQTRGSGLDVIDQTQPQKLSQAVDERVAGALTRMMESVVQSGTGTRAQIPGVRVAGKSGTAEHGEGRNPHAWFTAFAPADDPKVAVAVVVEDGGNAGSEAAGGKVSAPIAREVMKAVINR